jgi:ubiquinone/menaquinone biosynthesis C-methylase UbiE
MPPLIDVRDLSRLAYGFIGSKVLFAALNLDLFSRLTQPTTVDALAKETGVGPNRLRTLLAALTAVGLVVREGERYLNAPASDRYLVRTAPAYFGDYYRFQIDRQIYPALEHLDAGIVGDTDHLAFGGLEGLLADPTEATAFSQAQHTGSLGPAYLLARTLDVNGRRRLLDVAGGSGAFSITLCNRHPEMTSVIIDFPNVIEVARRYVDAAGLGSRIRMIAADALNVEWPGDQDVILMSYLLSAVGQSDIPTLFSKAYEALTPGGLLVIHDFMLDDDRDGPALAALWFVQYLAYRTDSVSFTAAALSGMLADQGFVEASDQVLIDEITKVLVCSKPA